MAARLVADTERHSVLRLRYRACWDVYQQITFANAELLKKGQAPSSDQLLAEKVAATELDAARDELLRYFSSSRGGTDPQ